MNELTAHINDLNIDDAPKRERAFNPLFSELLPPELIDMIVTDDVLKSGIFGKTNNEIRHKKDQISVRAEQQYISDTEQAEEEPEYDHRLYAHAIDLRDQKYEAFQRKIRLYNKMLRPMREMSQ